MSSIEYIGEPAEDEVRPFSRATKSGGLMFVSGIRGGGLGSATEETRDALNAMETLLEANGSSMDRVVQVTLLINNPADYHEIDLQYMKHFSGGLPARNTVRIGVPTQAKCAFSCVALAND